MQTNKMKFISVLLLASILSGCSINGGISNLMGSQSNAQAVSDTSTIEYANLDSKVLGKTMSANIYLPAGYDSKKTYPVLYLFHGFGGGRYDWLTGYGVEERMDVLLKTALVEPGIIVCPDIKNSYGINTFDGPAKIETIPDGNENVILNYGRYEDYILKELIPYIEDNYAVSKKRKDRYIGGFSMGAHVALRLAFTYPDTFSKVGGHAPSLRQVGVDMSPMIQKMIYPTQDLREARDPLYLAKTASIEKMKVYLDIGEDDMPEKERQLATEDLANILESRKISYAYHLNPGTHSGDYISANATKYLLFYFGK